MNSLMEILVSMLKIDENKNWCCCIAMHLFNVQNAATSIENNYFWIQYFKSAGKDKPDKWTMQP